MAVHRVPVPVHDGAAGGPVARTEPKVRAAAYAALVTPIVLVLIRQYAPGLAGLLAALPLEAQAGIGTALTGAVTWLAGYMAQAVHRIDLLPGPEPEAPVGEVDTEELVHAVADEVFDRLARLGVVPSLQEQLPPVPPAG